MCARTVVCGGDCLHVCTYVHFTCPKLAITYTHVGGCVYIATDAPGMHGTDVPSGHAEVGEGGGSPRAYCVTNTLYVRKCVPYTYEY